VCVCVRARTTVRMTDNHRVSMQANERPAAVCASGKRQASIMYGQRAKGIKFQRGLSETQKVYAFQDSQGNGPPIGCIEA